MSTLKLWITVSILAISSDLLASSKVVICSSEDSVAGSLKDSIVNRHQMASRERTRKGFYTRLFQVELKHLMGATYQLRTTSLTAFCHKGEQCMGPHQVESREVNLEEDGDVIRHQKNEDTVDVYINQRTRKCVVKSYNFRINPHLRNFSGDIR